MVAVSIVGMAFSTGAMLVYTFGVFAKPLAAEFHASRAAIALSVSMMDIIVAFSAPGAGRVVDRYGARGVIVASLFGLAACLAGLAFVSASFVAFLRDLRRGGIPRRRHYAGDIFARDRELVRPAAWFRARPGELRRRPGSFPHPVAGAISHRSRRPAACLPGAGSGVRGCCRPGGRDFSAGKPARGGASAGRRGAVPGTDRTRNHCSA